MFISMMPMIFIFGFAKKYLLEKKLGHFEKSFRARVTSAVVTLGFVINLRAFFKGLIPTVISFFDQKSDFPLCFTKDLFTLGRLKIIRKVVKGHPGPWNSSNLAWVSLLLSSQTS